MSLHVQKHFPPERLRRIWMLKMRERIRLDLRRNDPEFHRWKLSQQRQQWIYTVLAAMALALVAFVVSGGGCR